MNDGKGRRAARLDKPVCGAPTRSNVARGPTCTRSALPGSTRCYHHQDSESPGLARTYKSRNGEGVVGRYSAIRGRLAQHYERALADATILDPVRDLAMQDALVQKALEEAHALDTPNWRADLLAISNRMERAQLNGNMQDFATEFVRFKALMERGAAQADLLARAFQMVDTRAERLRKIKETEIKAATVVTMRDMARIFECWVAVLERELPEEEVIRLVPILREQTRVTTKEPPATMAVEVDDVPVEEFPVEVSAEVGPIESVPAEECPVEDAPAAVPVEDAASADVPEDVVLAEECHVEDVPAAVPPAEITLQAPEPLRAPAVDGAFAKLQAPGS